MGDPVLIGIRFALYADLMLIAGLAAFPLFALTRSERVGLLSLELQPFWDLVRETEVGTAWVYRSAALLLALGVAIWMVRWPTTSAAVLAAAGSVAVASLVWSGHAGATEGAAGTVHRISDILHLIAAAVWIGAIGAFLILISPRRVREWPGGLQIAARSLDQFSRVGTICVLVIAATGLVNSQMIVGAENLGRSLGSPYGQLPDLAIAAMRRSLIIEASAALAILALVAWFGTLEPFVTADPV